MFWTQSSRYCKYMRNALFSPLPQCKQYSAITYHGFCVGMGLMYVTLPRNIMQRFSKHSVLTLLKYPRVSQHLIAWNILAQNSSKQNFMGRVIMSSGEKNCYPFLTCWQWFHPFFCLPVKIVNRHFLKQRGFFFPQTIFLVLASRSCLFSMNFKVFPWGFSVCSCNESETCHVFLLIFVCNCQSV